MSIMLALGRAILIGLACDAPYGSQYVRAGRPTQCRVSFGKLLAGMTVRRAVAGANAQYQYNIHIFTNILLLIRASFLITLFFHNFKN
jgi:hypothetical protein